MRGDSSCQKSNVPGTAIGQNHAGEQENKIIKNRGDITGITRNENTRTRHFLAAAVLSSISKEIMEIGEAISQEHLRNITSYLRPTISVKMKTYLHSKRA